ncbi:MAG: V-type ATP synthase subunit I [Candidatus Kaiserbacteria bacterium]|nr:V-type ATP synthase subunit I [Candidatus Kaiserbacteria bacterium]MCB9816186.1 V-type ATP synthase subunit I [Candidatus Nomurabacteria bacterium]
MAVVPMQKVRLVVHGTQVDAALDLIQRSGAVEFRATKLADTTEPELYFPHAQLLPRVQHAVQWLAPYAPEVGAWQKLREGTRAELTEEAVAKQLADTDVVASVADDLERLQVEFAETEERVRVLEEKRDLFAEWKKLPIKLSDLATMRTVTFLLKGHQATDKHPLKEMVANLCESEGTAHVITEISVQQIALTIANDPDLVTKAKGILEAADAEVITLPEGIETVEVELTAVEEQLAKAKGDLALLHDQAEHFAITHYKTLRVASEVLAWQRDRFAVVDDAAATRYTVVFDGWLMADHRTAIEAAFAEKGIAAAFAEVPLEDGEEPPVEIRNTGIAQPFEAVTRLYGMPGYSDLDPTAYLAAFFFLFFGMSLTDVGYGLALVLVTGFLLLFAKLSKATRSFAKLLFYVGIATVFVGALFGGYFGIAIDQLPAPLQAIALFDPIGNPLPVFYLALGLGVFQVMVGMMLKIYSEYRNGRLMDGVLDQGPWLFMFVVGILYLCTTLAESGAVTSEFFSMIIGVLAFLSASQLSNLALVAVALILLGSGRNGTGIVGKIISALAGLYAGVGHFSDILSYSRLLALGLATSALAFAVNLIAGMVSGVPYVGFIFTATILFIGHAFTLAINTLGAFVHSARLQFVEFFGKFIAGTGKEFSPLKRSEDYITIKDD